MASETTPLAATDSEGQQKRSNMMDRLGPGVIAGAANDDPSCIVTYSIAGASFGYATLWTSLYLLPVIGAAQLMSSRLGMVSGRGLAGDVRIHFPRWVLVTLCCAIVTANVITIAADLGGMAEVTQMLLPLPAPLWTFLYAASIVALLFFFPYRKIERILRWLCLALFAYVVAVFMAKPDWQEAIQATIVPRFQSSGQYTSTLVAIIGATVSPYFLFWQAAAEVEAEYALGRRTVAARVGASPAELSDRKSDVYVGSFVSKLITYCITLTAAATLFANQREIATARDAAAALEPISGLGATLLFAVGIIGTGLIAVPVLAGSSAYAVAEAFRWRASLDEKPRLARKFYAVVGVSVAVGLVLNYLHYNPVQMLFWASVLNGLLAPVCIVLVLLLTNRKDVMGAQTNPPWLRALGWMSALVTGTAAIVMCVDLLNGP